MIRLFPVLLLLSCEEYELHPEKQGGELLVPVAMVDPPLLRFPAREPGDTVSALFELHNGGDALLQVYDLRVEGSGAYSLVASPAPLDLSPGESTWVKVLFDPINLANDAQVVVVSDDPEQPELPVRLSGEGLIPRLVVAPPAHDFGLVGLGCEEELTFSLVNAGTADLEIRSALRTGAAFDTELPELPLTLPPGHGHGIEVRFAPEVPGPVQGRLWFESNDPAGDDTATLAGEGVAPGPVVERFEQPTRADAADILLYIDRSTSMDDDAVNLTDNFQRFVATLGALDTDWQLMVATEDDGCHNGPLITADTDDLWNTFREAVHGSGGMRTESGLSIAVSAMEQASTPDGCNWGFLRQGAQTSILLVSDEPEQSLAPWTLQLARILAIAPDAVLSSVAGPVPDGCATAEPGAGYWEVSVATGGAFLDICDTDWGEGLQTLANISVGLQTVFHLDQQPWPDTLEVYVDGVRVWEGWRYDEALNAVIFEAPPPEGSEVEVRYDWSGAC